MYLERDDTDQRGSAETSAQSPRDQRAGRSLGRGLAAILGDGDEQKSSSDTVEKTTMLDIDFIIVNKEQPRKHFDEEKLKELANSISIYGVIQPLSVRRVGNSYMLIAGERRLRACKMIGIKQVPVYVIECAEDDILTISLIENIQRDDLNAIEEAEAFKMLIDRRNCTQESLATTISKSRSYVTNTMRLLALPRSIKESVKNGQLSSGHAKLLVGLDNAEELATECINKKMSVRAFEKLIREGKWKRSEQFVVDAPGTGSGGFDFDSDSRGELPEEIGETIRGNLPGGSYKGYDKGYDKGYGGTPIKAYINPEEEEVANMITQSLGLNTRLKITNNGGIVTIYCNTCEQLEGLTQLLLSVGQGTFPGSSYQKGTFRPKSSDER
ncbi:MAG: ParB/RepB/Spo0J family partition protein [Holosporales bacterium]|nr:ParB/RepB/Spo0J family partition protein [Holosporales bacterium]